MKSYFLGLVIVFLFSSIRQSAAQEFSFSSAANPREELKYDEKIAAILDTRDFTEFKAYLDKNPKTINRAVLRENYEGIYKSNAVRLKPLLFKLIDDYLDDKRSIEWIEYTLNFKGCNWYILFSDNTPFYYLLDYISTHKSNESLKAETLIFLFSRTAGFEMNKPFRDRLPPLPYLLRKSFQHTGGHFDPEYLSSDILKLFIEKGASVNTYDHEGNNLMLVALAKGDNDLIQFLISKNINLTKINKEGQDALYLAIANNNQAVVKQIISLTENRITPSYLHLINISELDIYRSVMIKELLLNASYANIKDVSDIIIFAKMFYQDKRKLLNPIPINLPSERIPAFVSIFNNESLSSQESEIITNLKIKYINTSQNYSEVIKRLNVFPFFRIANYNVSDYAMEKENKVNLLRDETNNIPQIFGQLKKTLSEELVTIQANVNKIRENKLYVNQFYKDIDIIDTLFFIQEGDGATFWEFNSISETHKFKKYKMVAVCLIQNSSNNKAYKIELGVNFRFKINANAFVFNLKNTEETVSTKSWIEIEPQETKPIVTVYDFREDFVKIGIFSHNEIIDSDRPYEISYFKPIYETIDPKFVYRQQDLINQLRTNGKLKNKKGFNSVIDYSCNNCIIDPKKSKGPKWEMEGFIWRELVKKDGVIVMKNGKEYSFKKYVREGKIFYKFDPSIFSSGVEKEYSDFDSMLMDFEKKCKQRFCNNF